MSRSKRTLAWVSVGLVLAGGLSATALAQEPGEAPGVLTWIAYSDVESGKMEDAVALVLEDAELVDGLMEDGTVLGWGIGTPINHDPGDRWDFVQWVHLSDWDAVDRWVEATFARMQSRSEEETAEMLERARDVFVEGSHFDEVVRHAVGRFDRLAGGGDAPATRYVYSAEFTAKPGRSEAMVELFRKHVAPRVDGMIDAGRMTGYGVYAPELHLDVEWTHRFWYGLPSLAGMIAMREAFATLDEGFAAQADAIFDPDRHHDKVLRVLHLEMAD